MALFPLPPMVVVAAVLTLLPFLVAAFWPVSGWVVSRWPVAARILLPAVLCVPYVLVTLPYGAFRWSWFSLYLLLPVAISWLLYRASIADPEQHGDWRD